MPPIRNKIEVEQQKQMKEQGKGSQKKEEKELKRDITPMFDYYKAWDKFAAD